MSGEVLSQTLTNVEQHLSQTHTLVDEEEGGLPSSWTVLLVKMEF